MDSYWALPITALTLGLRHGVDWDHIAAISDLVATSPSANEQKGRLLNRRLLLAGMYALGHAAAIAVIGICAMSLHSILPTWIDPIMDFLVGLTLIFLGVCVLKAALEQLSRREQFHPQSRGQIIWAFLKKRNGQAGSGDVEGYPGVSLSAQSGLLGASLVGVIHAVSAETGTQSLLIASVGDADSHGLGIVMLLAFIVGLLISNSLIAIFSAAGFVSSSASKFVLLSLSVVTAIFSIAVGVLFIAGLADLLPDLTANCNRLLRQ